MSEKTPEERTKEANARQAEAAARQAEAAAEKAEQEREEWESELAKQAREAKNRQAIAEADEKAREAGQTVDDELARQKLEAEAKKAIAEADKAAADAERAQASALIPDFSKITTGETKVEGTQAAFGSQLGRMALEKAAAKVVGQLSLSMNDTVLITTEADLASTDVVHVEVVAAFDTLTKAADDLLRLLDEKPAFTLAVGPSAVAGAIASALPGLLSLFSAKRTLSSFALTADTTAAVAAVASGLAGKTHVRIDDFRVARGGRVAAKETTLREARSRLVRRKLEREEDKAQAGQEKQAALDAIAELESQLAGLKPDDPKRKDLEHRISQQQQILEEARDRERKASVAIPLISELITGIDAFLGSVHTIPSGGTRSPFAIAVLRQQLHTGDDGGETPAFTKVLFLEASAGAVDQLLNDRPLWFKDRMHSIGSVAISFWLMDTATSDIAVSGVASAVAEIRGKIGGELELETRL